MLSRIIKKEMPSLFLFKCDINQAIGLSDKNKALLMQNDAIKYDIDIES
jgi:hypothetical protein